MNNFIKLFLFISLSLFISNVLQAQSNDECSGAITVVDGGSYTGSTTSATDSRGFPSADVWYKYVGEQKEVTLSLCEGTDYNSYIRVFVASNCQVFRQIAGNDDGCSSGGASQVTFFAEDNSDYYILIEGYEMNTGNFTLNISVLDNPEDKQCINASPFCADSPVLFEGGTNRPHSNPRVNYGCLRTTPNPAWFFMEIDRAGTHTIDLRSLNNVDVDIAVWGPFAAGSSLDTICIRLSTEDISPVDCSYSANSTETMNFTSTSVGEVWIILITNFSNQPTTIRASQTAGTGQTDCTIVPCSGTVSVSGERNVCNTSTTTYSTFSNGATNLIYSLSPNNAGTINASTGRVIWNSSFFGRATVSVVASYTDCQDVRASIPVEVFFIPEVSLSASQTTICKGDMVTFEAVGTHTNSPSSYDFRINNISVQNGFSDVFTSNSLANSDRVEVIQTNGACSTISNQISINVNQKPVLTSFSTEYIKFTCEETELLFTVRGQNLENANYDFRVNGVSVQTGSQNTYRAFSLYENDEVYAIVTKNGCQAKSFENIIDKRNGLNVSLITSSDTVNCQTSEIVFTARANLEDATYNFLVNGISTQNGIQDTFTTNSLSVNDTVTVIASKGFCKERSRSIIMNGRLDFEVNIVASATKICPNSEVIFTTTTNPTLQNLNYDFKINGVSVQNSTQNTFAYSSFSDNDKVTVTVSSQDCKVISNKINIEVSNELTANLSVTKSSICEGEEIVFTADDGFENYNFMINGNSVQNSTSNIFTSNSISNRDNISVLVGNDNCQAESNSIQIIVYPILNVTLSATKTVLTCQESEIIFTASTIQDAVYDFRINGVSVQSSDKNTFSSASNSLKKNDTVQVFIVNRFCESVSNKIIITENKNLNVTLSASKTNLTCQDTNVFFTASVSSDLENGNYDFRINGFSVQNSNQNILTSSSLVNSFSTLSNNDKITVIVTNGNCTKTSNEIVITFTETLNVELSASKTTIEKGENIIFTANSDTENINYNFILNGFSVQNGSSSVLNSNSISTPLENNDIVTVIITKGICRVVSNTVTVSIIPPNTGLYPNPTPDKITYNLISESEGAYTIRVFDAIGKFIWEEEKQKEDTFLKGVLNLGSLAKGMYIIEFTDENETRIFKIIKE